MYTPISLIRHLLPNVGSLRHSSRIPLRITPIPVPSSGSNKLVKLGRPFSSHSVLQHCPCILVDSHQGIVVCFWKRKVFKFASSCSELTVKLDKKLEKLKSKPMEQQSEKPQDQEKSVSNPQNGQAINSGQTTSKDVKGGQLSKRAQKRLSRSQKHKELKKQRKEESLRLAQSDDAGYKSEDFNQSHYIFENGLRKVYPYPYVFSTHAKGRWVGRILYDVLSQEFGFDHPNELKNSFDQGKILVNNVKVEADYVIKDCDYISHRIHRHENSVTGAPIEILHDSDDVVVINKPSSIPCHPCGRYRFNSIVFIMGKEMGYTNLRNIYRLDRLTSGVLILGKTAQHTKLLEDQVFNRQVKKEYVCRVKGKFPDGRVVVDQPLKALSNKLRLQVVSPSGKASKTAFERISYNGTSSVVKCYPETGRTHQIRVHLQYLGHPILNDGFYNNPAWGPNQAKDGKYEVPHYKVCERILAEHHVNLWDGGENPLYVEKERACRETGHQVDSAVNAEVHNGDDKSLSQSQSEIDRDGSHSSLVKEASNACDEPVCKKLKTEDCVSENKLNGVNKGEGVDVEICGKVFSNEEGCDGAGAVTNLSQPVNLSTLEATSDAVSADSESNGGVSVTLDKTTNAQNISANNCHSEQVVVQQHSETGTSMEGEQNRAELDSIDLDCELCKRRPIDPEPKHLVMFLHALKYKGPGWEFESPLPDWAQEDWNKEDDFML